MLMLVAFEDDDFVIQFKDSVWSLASALSSLNYDIC